MSISEVVIFLTPHFVLYRSIFVLHGDDFPLDMRKLKNQTFYFFPLFHGKMV